MKTKLIPKFLTASGYFRYLNDPEFMARMAARHGTVPGTNTNSGEKQNSKLTTLKKKKDEGTISRGDVVVKARKQGRNLADEKEETHRFMTTYPDATQRALDKTADILNRVGTVSGLGALGMGLLVAPGATLGGLAGSYLGEKPVDALTNYVVNYNKRGYYPYLSEEDNNNKTKYTTLTDLISEKTGLSPNMASFLHPGMWIGGGLGSRAGQAVQSTVLSVAPRAAQFLASPYTGKWTLFGNREYRIKPGYATVNGIPLDSRPVSQATERSLINLQGTISTNRARRELALRNALDLYTNENIGEFFPGYGLNIAEQHIPGYRPFLGITGPRFGLWALQEDVNSKLAERGAEPLRILEPNGFINREQRSVIIPRSTQRETLAAPPLEVVVEGLENTAVTPTRRKTYVDIANGDERLRPDEVFDSNGNVRPEFTWRDTDSGWRGMRNWFREHDDARTRSSKYWDAVRNTGRHGRAILSDNPPTISGMRNQMHNGEYSFDSAMLAAKMLGRLYKSGATWHHAKPTFHESEYLLKDGKYYARANDLGQINRYTKENFDPKLEKILMQGNELPQEINVEILSDGSLQYIDSNGRILGTLKRRSNLSIVDQMNTITRGINELYGQQGANIPDSFVDEYGNIWWGQQPGFMLKHGGIVKLLNKK